MHCLRCTVSYQFQEWSERELKSWSFGSWGSLPDLLLVLAVSDCRLWLKIVLRMTSEDGKAWGFLSLVVGALPWVDPAWRLPPMRRQAKDDYILYKGRGCKDQMFRTLGHAKCRDPVCDSSILGPAHRWTALFWECSSVRGISDHQRVTICCYLAKLSMIDLSSCWVPRFLLFASLGRVTFEHLRSSAEPNPSRTDIFIEPCRHGSRLFPPNSWYLSTAKGSNIWSMNRRQKQVWFCFLTLNICFHLGSICWHWVWSQGWVFLHPRGRSTVNGTFEEAWPPGVACVFLVDVNIAQWWGH